MRPDFAAHYGPWALLAGGSGPEVQRLRTLPRDEAVRAIAAFSQAAQATGAA
jgi:hypothetical protein